ncbi:hypothetical protein [Rickettsiella grylli]|uniref:Uncharacterized protein n=1 Tax=Rickettsiella grylli TaxID=59196 RepID=A8PNT1_9COXI|nr:hypothetical protein [Rickettsiella grylli]EDP46084.1 hypothetical protein RICGR_1106 [Rickettsiella grylli]
MNDEKPDFGLEALFSQLSKMTSYTEVNRQAYLYLLLLWNYFEVSFSETENNTSKTEKPNIIHMDHAYSIVDYGTCLKVSAGRHYGCTSTGRLLTTVKEMIKLLSHRGAKQLHCEGLIAAKRFAWLECEKYKIKIINFIPDKQTLILRSRLPHLDSFRPQF